MRSPSSLTRDELCSIVVSIRDFLYVERHDDNDAYFDPDKACNGADFVEHVIGLLDRHGLAPEAEQPYVDEVESHD